MWEKCGKRCWGSGGREYGVSVGGVESVLGCGRVWRVLEKVW